MQKTIEKWLLHKNKTSFEIERMKLYSMMPINRVPGKTGVFDVTDLVVNNQTYLCTYDVRNRTFVLISKVSTDDMEQLVDLDDSDLENMRTIAEHFLDLTHS